MMWRLSFQWTALVVFTFPLYWETLQGYRLMRPESSRFPAYLSMQRWIKEKGNLPFMENEEETLLELKEIFPELKNTNRAQEETEIHYDESTGKFYFQKSPLRFEADAEKVLPTIQTISYRKEELEVLWNDLLRKEKVSGKLNLEKLLPFISNGTTITEFLATSASPEISEEIYTTEKELKARWLAASGSSNRLPAKDFSIEQSLLLLDNNLDFDLDKELLEQETDESLQAADEMASDLLKTLSTTAAEEATDESEIEELAVTEQELKRIWKGYSDLQWGLPSKDFSIPAALLLLENTIEENEFDYGEEEYYEAYVLPAVNDNPARLPFGSFHPSETSSFLQKKLNEEMTGSTTANKEEVKPFEEIGSVETKNPRKSRKKVVSLAEEEATSTATSTTTSVSDTLADLLERTANDLDNESYYYQPIDRSMEITPGDMINQYNGDINYLEFTIEPQLDRIENVNWDVIPGVSNPKLDFLNYLTLPNETFIDYNQPKKRSWEIFDFPWGRSEESSNSLSHNEGTEGVISGKDGGKTEEKEINWEEFDFTQESDSAFPLSDSQISEYPEDKQMKEDDNPPNVKHKIVSIYAPEGAFEREEETFFDQYEDEDADAANWIQYHTDIIAREAKEKKQQFRYGKPVYEEGELTPFTPDRVNNTLWETSAQKYDGELAGRFHSVYASPIKNFQIPKKWLQRARYADYVGREYYEQRNITNPEIGEEEEVATEDDVYEFLSVQRILNVMNVYLKDHQSLAQQQDEERAFDRYLFAKLRNLSVTYPVLEPIPDEMTPDKDRGIKYSTQIFESNSEYYLFPYQPSPKELYSNENFELNRHMEYPYIGGTVLEQYDWLPQPQLLPHLIEEEKVLQLQPVIRFINYAGKLVSTKNDIIVFEYYGKMRDLYGIRCMMLEMAKRCYPSTKDLRLETKRTHDSFDVGDHDWTDPQEYAGRPLVEEKIV